MDTPQPEQCCAMVHATFESLSMNPHDQGSKLSLEQAPELELKVLSAHLKYAYLGEGNTLPIIISTTLFVENELALFDIL